mgnify:CR=1 FL=1
MADQEMATAPTTIDALPRDMLVKIFKHLSQDSRKGHLRQPSLGAAMRTCARWRKEAADDEAVSTEVIVVAVIGGLAGAAFPTRDHPRVRGWRHGLRWQRHGLARAAAVAGAVSAVSGAGVAQAEQGNSGRWSWPSGIHTLEFETWRNGHE